MNAVRTAIVLSCVVTFAACGGPARVPQGAIDLAAEGLKAFERSDWRTAAPLLREAITRDPGSLKLHYWLAIAATHLELREEAIREFNWVLVNAPPASREAEVARKWLTDAGLLLTGAGPAAGDETALEAPEGVERARLAGRVVWTEPDGAVKTSRLQLFLKGAAPKTQEEYHVLRTDEEGRFEFKNIAPGAYKLVNRIAGKPEWRLRLDIEPGQRLALDLTPGNSTRVRDDFPDER